MLENITLKEIGRLKQGKKILSVLNSYSKFEDFPLKNKDEFSFGEFLNSFYYIRNKNDCNKDFADYILKNKDKIEIELILKKCSHYDKKMFFTYIAFFTGVAGVFLASFFLPKFFSNSDYKKEEVSIESKVKKEKSDEKNESYLLLQLLNPVKIEIYGKALGKEIENLNGFLLDLIENDTDDEDLLNSASSYFKIKKFKEKISNKYFCVLCAFSEVKHYHFVNYELYNKVYKEKSDLNFLLEDYDLKEKDKAELVFLTNYLKSNKDLLKEIYSYSNDLLKYGDLNLLISKTKEGFEKDFENLEEKLLMILKTKEPSNDN